MSKKKSLGGKIWNFIWHDDSGWSWIVNIILAFIIIKFLLYPGLGLVLGTNFPIVAVVSGSMEHDGSFDQWWSSQCCADQVCSEKVPQSEIYKNYGLEKSDFDDFPYTNGFNTGDIMVLAGAENIKLGDIIVFNIQSMADPIIHRVVEIKQDNVYTTKGDHNCGSSAGEKNLAKNTLLGKSVLRIPYLGWVKIWFVKNPVVFTITAIIVILIMAYWEDIKKRIRGE